jgi:hypothetical protein
MIRGRRDINVPQTYRIATAWWNAAVACAAVLKEQLYPFV